LPVGAIFEERFEVVNPTRYGRLWIEIEDQSNLPGSRSSKFFQLLAAGNPVPM
jgi:hypothetical protein